MPKAAAQVAHCSRVAPSAVVFSAALSANRLVAGTPVQAAALHQAPHRRPSCCYAWSLCSVPGRSSLADADPPQTTQHRLSVAEWLASDGRGTESCSSPFPHPEGDVREPQTR